MVVPRGPRKGWHRLAESRLAAGGPDHLIAVVPEFGLRVFQQPTGADIERAFGHASPGGASANLG